MKDYPAAHSMDTEWFAVDASGNLAIFDSGESGAIPELNDRVWQASRIGCLDDFWLKMSENNEHRCIQVKTPGTAVAKSLTSNKLQRGINLAIDRKYKILSNWLLQLSSERAIATLGIQHRQYNYAVRFSGEPIVIYVKECKISIVRRLIDDGVIIAGQQLGKSRFRLASLFGLFVYDQYFCNLFPIPYISIGKPIVPLCLEDLPEHLQDAVIWNWFDRLLFPESQKIQPIEHMRCRTWRWDKWWIDTEDREHEKHPHHPI